MKRYIRERGSALVRRLLTSHTAATSRLSEIEIASALTRRERENSFAVRQRDRALTAIEADFAALVVVELAPPVCARARALLRVHRLRASDAVQLASCLLLQAELRQPVRFVAFDQRLTAAAHAEGVEVEAVPVRGRA